MPDDTFELADDCADYFVSRVPVKPLRVQVIEDPLSAALQRGVELRVQPNLWALRDAVIASTLAFSIIRWRRGPLLTHARSRDRVGHTRNPSHTCYRRRHHGRVVLPFRIPGSAGKASER